MEVCFLTSGETLTVLEDELQGKRAKAVKKALAAKVGISRFKQRFFVEDGSEIQDDEVLDPAPLRFQLVVLEFWPTDDEETEKMISASRDNDLVALEQLLQHPRNPNEASNDGKTPLLHAAEQGHVPPMELLLEAGAKTDQSAKQWWRHPCWLQLTTGTSTSCDFWSKLVQPKIKQITMVQHPCCLQLTMGTSTSCDFLVEVGAAKDQATNYGATPLLVAAENGHLDIVRFLVEVRAAKDQADNNGATPLLIANWKGHLDVVRFLVEVGAAKDQADNNGANTPCWLQHTRGTPTSCDFWSKLVQPKIKQITMVQHP